MTTRTMLFTAAALAALGIGATATVAQDLPAPVQARKGQFQIMALNLGVLGNMARGNIDYDAEAAQTAADNLVAISQIDQSFHWEQGTDNATLAGTRALPAIWADLPDFVSRWEAFGASTAGLSAAAGSGLEDMRTALGPVGATCGACHDTYRASQ